MQACCSYTSWLGQAIELIERCLVPLVQMLSWLPVPEHEGGKSQPAACCLSSACVPRDRRNLTLTRKLTCSPTAQTSASSRAPP